MVWWADKSTQADLYCPRPSKREFTFKINRLEKAVGVHLMPSQRGFWSSLLKAFWLRMGSESLGRCLIEWLSTAIRQSSCHVGTPLFLLEILGPMFIFRLYWIWSYFKYGSYFVKWIQGRLHSIQRSHCVNVVSIVWALSQVHFRSVEQCPKDGGSQPTLKWLQFKISLISGR